MPDLQNIPVPKSAFHEQITQLVAEHRRSLETARSYLTADYAAVELRILEAENARS